MMTREEMLAQLQSVLSQEGIADAMKQADSLEDLRKVFRDHGMQATDEEIDTIIELMGESGKEGELSENELAGVSGGLGLGDLVTIAKITWEVGTWVSGRLVYGSQSKAKKEIKKFWGFD